MPKPVEQMTADEIMAELGQSKQQQTQAMKPVEQMSPDEIRNELAEMEKNKLHPVQSALIGAAQGISFGFSDELKAAGRAGIDSAMGKGSFDELYETYKQQERELIDRSRELNPGTTAVSQIGGAIAGGIGSGLAKAAGSVGGALARGAVSGGVLGAGESKADLTSVEGKKDILKGAATGALFEGAFHGIGKAFKAAGPKNLKRMAEERAVKALRPLKSMTRKLEKSGRTHDVGRTILDENILSFRASDALKKSKDLKKKAGQAIGDATDELDDIIKKAKEQVDKGELFGFVPKGGKEGFLIDADGNTFTRKEIKDLIDDTFGVNMKRVADRIRSNMIEEVKKNPPLRSQLKRLENLADDFEAMGTTSFDRGRIIKSSQGKLTKFDSEAVPQAFKKRLYGIIREELEDSAGKLKNLENFITEGKLSLDDIVNFDAARKAGSADELLAANKLYGKSVDIENLAQNLEAAVKTNRDIGLRDVILAAGGFSALGPSGLLLGLATNLSRKYGSQAAAIGLDKLAKVGAKVSKSRFGQILEEAARKSPNAFIATHISLRANEPEYKKILNQSNNRNFGIPEPSGQFGIPNR